MKNIIIIGAGGIGREVAWIIEEINKNMPTYNILGFVDDEKELWEQRLNGYKVLGGLEILNDFSSNVSLVIGIASCKVKKNIVEALCGKFKFESIIHPNVSINKEISVGRGCIIYPGTILTVNSIIENHVLISGNCFIGHDCKIEEFSSVLCGCSLSGYNVVCKGSLLQVGTKLGQGTSIGEKSRIS